MNILIVGGSGHVSGTLAKAALQQQHTVWTVTRGERPVPDGVRALITDRHDGETMQRLVGGENMVWDLVVDCICYDEQDMQQDIKLFSERTRHFVFVSTDFVYDPAHRTFPQPEDTTHYVTGGEQSVSYGSKKRRCEQILSKADTGSMLWTIVRPCHIYGPTSELGCLPLHGRDTNLIDKLRSGETIGLVGGGHFLQQPILADDLARTILSTGGNEKVHGKTFNVAGPDIIESWVYYQIIADILDVPLTIEEIPIRPHIENNPGQAPFLCHRIYDLSRLQESGLHVPSTPVTEGLRQHVDGLLATRYNKIV